MQQIVRGNIEPFRLGYVKVQVRDAIRTKELLLICNQEGKVRKIPNTCFLTSQYYKELISGICFICLADETNGMFEGLPQGVYKDIDDFLKTESIYRFDGNNVVLQIDVDKLTKQLSEVIYG